MVLVTLCLAYDSEKPFTIRMYQGVRYFLAAYERDKWGPYLPTNFICANALFNVSILVD